MQLRALAVLKKSNSRNDPRLQLISLALRGQAKGFEKVVKMIDDMVVLLGKEQVADDEKKAFCEAELDKAEDKLKGLNIKAADLETAIDNANGQVATLADEISKLTADVKQLDKDVASATELRKQEHADNTETIANDSAAKQLLDIAKNRLAKFYTPKLYKAAPKVELSAENRVVVSMGGTVAPTPAPGGIAGTGVTAFAEVNLHDNRVAPPPPPETWDAYAKKGEEHTGVVEMINMLRDDLSKEIAETETEEKENQAEYETFMADSAAKRADDTKSIAMKESAKADLGADVEKMTAEKGATMKEGMATAEYIKDLHLDCDWLIANFQTRKEARAGEVESLKNAKAVLAGADYSLLQRTRSAGPTECPSTELSFTNSVNAADTAVYAGVAFAPGECQAVGNAITAIKFCGPGTLTVSRMTCSQHHEHKAFTVNNAGSEYTSGVCRDIPLAGTNADGHLGSYKLTC